MVFIFYIYIIKYIYFIIRIIYIIYYLFLYLDYLYGLYILVSSAYMNISDLVSSGMEFMKGTNNTGPSLSPPILADSTQNVNRAREFPIPDTLHSSY